MNKKTGLQVVMVLIIVIISLWFYLKYFTKNFEDAKEAPIIEKIDANKDITSTFIDDINYVSTDAKGNKYQITAKQAEIENENSDVMFLKDVVAFIFIKDSDKIKITSSFSEYNSKNYDTIFSGNVIVFHKSIK
jgi:lipopolysaccharide export system protein LptC